MGSRRDFLKAAALGAAAAATGLKPARAGTVPRAEGPLVVSTWDFGTAANETAWARLAAGDPALDAVVAGVGVAEADPDNRYVGLGGLPDRDGRVTLDACVMDHRGEAGAVAGLADVVHAAAVARDVMDHTPHVLLVGEGARRFALERGYPETDLLVPEAEARWRDWLREDGRYAPEINAESHDTISMLAIDRAGRLAGACTTSGLMWKLPGRVGDSPIIGASLFVDDAVGAACATGLGEAVLRTCGSFLVVEHLRRGLEPAEACRAALARIVEKDRRAREIQVAYVAVTRDGRVGGWALQPGFSYAVRTDGLCTTFKAPAWFPAAE